LGFKRGITAEVLTLLGLVTAIFVAIFWYADLSVFLIKQFKWNQTLSNVISFILIFILVIIVFRVLENILTRITALLLLNWVNNLGGALFGFMRGALIVSLLIFLINFIPLVVRTQFSESMLADILLDSLIVIYNSIREWLPEHFQFDFEILKERLFRNIN